MLGLEIDRKAVPSKRIGAHRADRRHHHDHQAPGAVEHRIREAELARFPHHVLNLPPASEKHEVHTVGRRRDTASRRAPAGGIVSGNRQVAASAPASGDGLAVTSVERSMSSRPTPEKRTPSPVARRSISRGAGRSTMPRRANIGSKSASSSSSNPSRSSRGARSARGCAPRGSAGRHAALDADLQALQRQHAVVVEDDLRIDQLVHRARPERIGGDQHARQRAVDAQLVGAQVAAVVEEQAERVVLRGRQPPVAEADPDASRCACRGPLVTMSGRDGRRPALARGRCCAGAGMGVAWVVQLTLRAGLQPRARQSPKRNRAEVGAWGK
jgi:hypothetical protein